MRSPSLDGPRSGGHDIIGDVVRDHASAHRLTASELVSGCTRAHGLLDLAPDQDTGRLATRLEPGRGRVVLTNSDYAAYARLTDRLIAMFHPGDHLARFLYRG